MSDWLCATCANENDIATDGTIGIYVGEGTGCEHFREILDRWGFPRPVTKPKTTGFVFHERGLDYRVTVGYGLTEPVYWDDDAQEWVGTR